MGLKGLTTFELGEIIGGNHTNTHSGCSGTTAYQLGCYAAEAKEIEIKAAKIALGVGVHAVAKLIDAASWWD
jgi:hypothetical protein